jgi:polar amino acid transport system permease protein
VDVWAQHGPALLAGLATTVRLTAISVLVGLVLSVALAAMVQAARRPMRWLGLLLVEVARGFPVLVLLYLVYFGLPQAGLTFDAQVAGVIGLAYNFAGFGAECLRSGHLAVPRGQREAAKALGLTPPRQFRHVVFPQALRIAIPPLVGAAVLTFQGSALLFAISVPELLSAAYTAGSASFDYLTPICVVAVLYAAVSIPLSRLVGVLERRLAARL